MATSNSTKGASPGSVPTLSAAAYAESLPEYMAVPQSELLHVNVRIATSVNKVLGALPGIVVFLPEIEDTMPKYDLVPIRKLEVYAMGLSHAETLYVRSKQANGGLSALAEQASAVRERLVLDAAALGNRGIINANRLKKLKGPVGYENVAFDLQLLARLFRDSFDASGATTSWPIERAELDEAERVSAAILRGIRLEEQAPSGVAAAADMRRRAFTVFANAYDHARRAISHLRWKQEDLDTIAPSLYARRGRRKTARRRQPPRSLG